MNTFHTFSLFHHLTNTVNNNGVNTKHLAKTAAQEVQLKCQRFDTTGPHFSKNISKYSGAHLYLERT